LTVELDILQVGGILTPAVAPTVSPEEVINVEPSAGKRRQGGRGRRRKI
jgi:hypothetical protein